MANSPPLELWVRAGADGVTNGADPVCQQIFQILLLKAQEADKNGLHFNVKTTSPVKPNKEFLSSGLKHTPGMIHGDELSDHPDEIIEYVDMVFKPPVLQYFDSDADNATADLFHKFCFFIREVNKDPQGLETELRRVDGHLTQCKTKFLTGDQMTHLDCRILPFLQHIRIAAAYLKGYSIPNSLHSLWNYMKNGYEHEAFTKSCPSDQEIILYWAERKDTPNVSLTKGAELATSEPVFTFTVPDGK